LTLTDELVPGLYEALVTGELRARIERARRQGKIVDLKAIDDKVLIDVLARHLHDRVRDLMVEVPASRPGRREIQVGLINRLLRELVEPHSQDASIELEPNPSFLMEVAEPRSPDAERSATHRPGISLRESVLLTNGHGDLQIGTQVALEILSADRIDLLCAFVRFAGIRLIRRELQQFLLRGGQMRVIASVYTGSTEKRALDELVGLGAKVKVSYETARTRLHAKAWLFERDSGYQTAYVGSSNLTHSALLDGLEWNVRATAVDNPAILERVAATFEQYWNEPEFESYDPRVDGDRLQAALDAETGPGVAPAPFRLSIDAQPKPFQVEILEALSAERQRGHFRNLVVAPTGTGKTWVSAFDFRRLRAMGYERLLFVAHRNEILQQSQEVFRVVLDEPDFGARFVASERPEHWDHVFASIQSLSRAVEDLDPERFDVVIVDEFHHAEADTYRRLLNHLKPRVLLGLTATPERADGREILHWFDDRVASEMRLWEALDDGLLCPFHYLGVGDGTDLSGVGFVRGRYVASELEGILTGDHVRASRILDSVREWVLDPSKMGALGFCVGIGHARFMAQQFTAAGLASVALDGSTDAQTRAEAVRRLRRGEIRAIFTVDIFNEGIDIPEVDTILLLRPTESATVFLQQLGRGLRWSEGKSVLTVLDFIGQAHADYRFDTKFRALMGGTKRMVERALEAGMPLMPPGCAIQLDEIAQKIVLENLRSAIKNTRRAIIDDLRGLPESTTLSEFLAATSFDLLDVYASPSSGSTFTSARRAARRLRDAPTPSEAVYSKALGKMLHVDDEERYLTWRSWLTQSAPPAAAQPGSRDERLQWMLFAALGQRQRPLGDFGDALRDLWAAPAIKGELIDLLDVLRERTRLDARPIDASGLVPIHSHATYGLYEIMAAYGLVSQGSLRENREGVVWVEAQKSDLLLITLNKSDSDYSATTRYDDYPVSQTRFHWESQSRTATTSPTGQRYINHAVRGSKVVLFARENRRDERDVSSPYLCLGAARHVGHKSDRPMQIDWELDRPMPVEIYEHAKVAAG
jgi:superfamily II DNA or RNA helicase/HKD family nuclease